MAIKAMPIVSGQVYLSDLLSEYPTDEEGELTNRAKVYKSVSDAVAKLEGDCPKDEAAWVIVRQATEQDNIRRADRVANRTVRWAGEDVSETRDDNMREQWAFEVWMCLCDTGNLLTRSGQPLFRFKESTHGYRQLDMNFADFLTAYGSLPSVVTTAMRRAVLDTNPDWDWLAGEE